MVELFAPIPNLVFPNILRDMGMAQASMDLVEFEKKANEVADILRALANERRLMILCQLVEHGEATVGSLVDAVGISQSALSQHLGKMRDEGIVAFRRDSLFSRTLPREETTTGCVPALNSRRVGLV